MSDSRPTSLPLSALHGGGFDSASISRTEVSAPLRYIKPKQLKLVAQYLILGLVFFLVIRSVIESFTPVAQTDRDRPSGRLSSEQLIYLLRGSRVQQVRQPNQTEALLRWLEKESQKMMRL